MSDPCAPVELLERIHAFSVRGANDELTEENWADFERLLRENDDACRLYGQYVDVSILLPAILSSIPAAAAPSTDVAFPEPQEPAPAPALPLLGTLWHGTIGFFSQEVPFALLVATLITCLGLVGGSMIYVTHNTQLASDTPRPTPLVVLDRKVAHSDIEFVGRVTGMVDAQWADVQTATVHGANVSLGRKYALASGLMEITYDTGARVILQGPVTYQVDSHDGGFLSLGKLTARVEKKVEASNVQSLIPNPSPLSPLPSPLFTIKTPTAVVTDLGTEFGVEVSKEGSTISHVFRGSVQVQRVFKNGISVGEAHVLHKNQSAHIEKENGNQSGGKPFMVFATPAMSTEFVRKIPKQALTPSHLVVVANWKFDDDQFLTDSSGNGHTLVNRGATQIDGTASFNGKGMVSSVDSIDLTPFTKVRVSWSQKATLPISDQVVWEQSDDFNVTPGAIIACNSATVGKASIRATDENASYNLDEYPVVADTWEDFMVEFNLTTDRGDHVAYRSDVVKVFKDGELIGTNTGLEGFAPDVFINAAFHIGGRVGTTTPVAAGFTGLIDNVKIEGMLKSNNTILKSTGIKAK